MYNVKCIIRLIVSDIDSIHYAFSIFHYSLIIYQSGNQVTYYPSGNVGQAVAASEVTEH